MVDRSRRLASPLENLHRFDQGQLVKEGATLITLGNAGSHLVVETIGGYLEGVDLTLVGNGYFFQDAL